MLISKKCVKKKKDIEKPFMRMTENIFVIPIFASNKYVLYSPLQKIAALVNQKAFQKLREHSLSPHSGLDSELDELYRQLLPDKPPPGRRSGTLRPDFLGLVTSRDCNMACIYCDFQSGKTGRKMAPEVAFRAVEWMADVEVESGRKLLNVHFFGGEPLLSMDMVKNVIYKSYLSAEEMGLRTNFEVCTNGTFSASDASWISDNFNTVILSLDGPQEIQNYHRPFKGGVDSFKVVDRNAKLLGKGQAALCIRICVTDETVRELRKTVKWILKRYLPSKITLEPLKGTDESQRAGLRQPAPVLFAMEFAATSLIARDHGVDVIYAATDINKVESSFCPVGKDGFIIKPDGNISACYQLEAELKKNGLELNFGQIDPGQGISISYHDLERIRGLVVTNKPRCRSCFCKWHCAGGCHAIPVFDEGSSYQSDFCTHVRIITFWKILMSLELNNLAESFLANPYLEGDGLLQSTSI